VKRVVVISRFHTKLILLSANQNILTQLDFVPTGCATRQTLAKKKDKDNFRYSTGKKQRKVPLMVLSVQIIS
jgi:hypothetical protein